MPELKSDPVKARKLKSSYNTPVPIIDEYRITERYENDRRSEYYYRLVYLYTNYGEQVGGLEIIQDMHKNNIGKTFYDDHRIWQIEDPNVNDLRRLYVVTFEREWYTSKKVVVWDDGLVSRCARMRFSDQYYQRFWVDYPTNGISFTHNEKGRVKIKF